MNILPKNANTNGRYYKGEKICVKIKTKNAPKHATQKIAAAVLQKHATIKCKAKNKKTAPHKLGCIFLSKNCFVYAFGVCPNEKWKAGVGVIIYIFCVKIYRNFSCSTFANNK